MTIGSFLEKNKIREYINKYGMLEKGDKVVIGLSGGPDSVCLFFVLLALKEEYNLSLKAVHINHMIRGKDADEDQAYVEKLCKDFGVECITYSINIPALAKESGRSLEEEARMARYASFEKEAVDSARIAVAHNADDNAETVLFHMARGAGLDGMTGIVPVRGKIIRPLLKVSKAEILALLDENGIDYCIDGTNSDVAYDRNRIRHNIMPELVEVNSQALSHISNMTEHMQEVQAFLDVEANGLLTMAKEPENRLRKRTLLTAPRLLRAQAIKQYLGSFMPDEKDVSAVHIDSTLELLEQDGEKYVDLPHKKRLIISYEEIFVVDTETDGGQNEYQGTFEIKEFSNEQGLEYPQSTYTKWFDCDKITGNIAIRSRMPGDYLVVNKEGGTKSIQDYFVDEKIPKHLRDIIPLVCDGNHVMWVVGHRISEYYKISADTKQILEVKYMEEIISNE